jgi:hypothetical protein
LLDIGKENCLQLVVLEVLITSTCPGKTLNSAAGLPARVQIPVPPSATSRLLYELLVRVRLGFLVVSPSRIACVFLHVERGRSSKRVWRSPRIIYLFLCTDKSRDTAASGLMPTICKNQPMKDEPGSFYCLPTTAEVDTAAGVREAIPPQECSVVSSTICDMVCSRSHFSTITVALLGSLLCNSDALVESCMLQDPPVSISRILLHICLLNA